MAASTSASSKTTQAPLPPSSSNVRFMARARSLRNGDTDGARSREAHRVDVAGVDERGRGGGPLAVDEVDRTRREPDPVENAHQLRHGQGVLGRRLYDHGVAGGQSRADLARHVREGEVVGGDAGHHSERDPVHHGSDHTTARERRRFDGLGQERGLEDRPGVPRRAFQAVHRQGDLQMRPDGRGGPGLGHHQRQQLGRFRPEGCRRVTEQRTAVLNRPGRPLRLCLLGRGHHGPGVVRTAIGRPADALFGGGIDDLVGPPRRLHPRAPDEELTLVVPCGLGHGTPLPGPPSRRRVLFNRVGRGRRTLPPRLPWSRGPGPGGIESQNYYFRHFAGHKSYDRLYVEGRPRGMNRSLVMNRPTQPGPSSLGAGADRGSGPGPGGTGGSHGSGPPRLGDRG